MFSSKNNFIAIFWGSFDPPSFVHEVIIKSMLNFFKHIVIVVNDMSNIYYHVNSCDRLKMLLKLFKDFKYKGKISFFIQSKDIKIDYFSFKSDIKSKLFIIVGYDSFCYWKCVFKSFFINNFDGIYVFSRYNFSFLLFKENVFLFKINGGYDFISSSLIRKIIIFDKKNIFRLFLNSDVVDFIVINSFYIF